MSSVIIPNSVKIIEGYAFEGCSNLTTATIGNSVTTIGAWAFSGCPRLSSVIIGNSVKTIGLEAFRGCSNLTTAIIGNSVSEIGFGAFRGCSKLSSVIIPNSVTTIRESAFEGCSNLDSLHIGNSVAEIDDWAFLGCSNLTHVTLGSSMKSIGNNFLLGCSKLSSITIPNSVTTIGESAFSGCSNLATVEIGNSVKQIKSKAFHKTNIKKIYCNAVIPPSIQCAPMLLSSVSPSFDNYNATLIVPKESVSLYRTAEGWKNFFIADKLKVEAYSDFYGTLAPEKRYEAKGVTADGESKLIVYVDDDKDFSELSTPEIHVKLNGGEVCADEKVIGTIGNWQKLDNGKWGFIYTAPQDYIGTGNSFLLDIELVGENSSLTACGQIKVYRPGVLFLHGFDSDKECFRYIYSELLKESYTTAQLLGDYENTNRASFHDNTHKNNVVQKHLNLLYCQLAGNGIVSSKYDLVGHSMGGILSRLYAQEVNNNTVNRIITINTPHFGSNLSILGQKVRELLEYIRTRAFFAKNPKWLLISAVGIHYIDKFMNGAGIDLAPNSSAIENLNRGYADVPVHAISSVLMSNNVDNQIQLFEMDNSPILGLAELFLNIIKNSSHNVLNMALGSTMHDGVVTLESQLGGLTSNYVTIEYALYRGVLGEKSDAHHINTCRWDETFNNLYSLLSSPKSSDKFCATGFPMTDLSVQQAKARANEEDDNIEFVEPVDSSYIKINVEVRNDSIKIAYVTVDKSRDMSAYSIFSFIDDNRMLIGSNKDTLRFALKTMLGT